MLLSKRATQKEYKKGKKVLSCQKIGGRRRREKNITNNDVKKNSYGSLNHKLGVRGSIFF